MAYIGNEPGPRARQVFAFTASAGQTVFSGLDSSGLTLNYTPGFLDVFVNGVNLAPADFTATDGWSVTVASGLSAGDILVAISTPAFAVADALAKTQNLADVPDKMVARANMGVGWGRVQKVIVGSAVPFVDVDLPATSRLFRLSGVYVSTTTAAGNQLGMRLTQAGTPIAGASDYGQAWLYNNDTTVVAEGSTASSAWPVTSVNDLLGMPLIFNGTVYKGAPGLIRPGMTMLTEGYVSAIGKRIITYSGWGSSSWNADGIRFLPLDGSNIGVGSQILVETIEP